MNIFNGLGFDWYLSFYPAINAFLAGNSPYQIPGLQFANPPWTLLILAPLKIFGPQWGFILLGIINLSGLFALFYKHQKARAMISIALSFPFLSLLVFGNIDGLSLWGLAIGGPIGLILLSTKPQVACLVAIVWIKQAWQLGRGKAVLKLTAPLIILAAVMIYMYPAYISKTFLYAARTDGIFTNGYPWFIPVGITALVAAFRHERQDLAAVAALLISPYARIQSWVGALSLLAIQYPFYGSILGLSTWIVFVIMVIS